MTVNENDLEGKTNTHNRWQLLTDIQFCKLRKMIMTTTQVNTQKAVVIQLQSLSQPTLARHLGNVSNLVTLCNTTVVDKKGV